MSDADALIDSAQPDFAYSLIVQSLLNGILLTLALVLFGVMLFTFRYHHPLAKINFYLQGFALVVFITNCLVSVIVILVDAKTHSHVYPYMFKYVEMTLPVDTWSNAVRALYLTLQCMQALSVHATHIQFLTLLFPSALERRLILCLLGPLALCSCSLSYLGLHREPGIQDLGDAIRATCNSTLTLLYTSSLLIWGLLINRSRAWKSEGSTASFGGISITLGLLGSIVNYLEIKVDRLSWLPNSIWCILVWQSWVSFWWFVGTGMYAGEVADRERRKSQRARRAAKKRAKKRRKEAQTALPSVALSASGHESVASRIAQRVGVRWRGVAVPESQYPQDGLERTTSFTRLTEPPSTLTRRNSQNSAQEPQDTIEMQDMSAPSRRVAGSEASSSSDRTSWTYAWLWPKVARDMLRQLAQAHNRATRSKALELPTTNEPMPFTVFSRTAENAVPTPENGQRPSRHPVAEHTPSFRSNLGFSRLADKTDSVTPAYSWTWKGPVRKARLRAVDRY